MSHNLDTATSGTRAVRDVHVTAFNGGEQGQMLQLHSGFLSNKDTIQMTEDQVRQAVMTMQGWLDGGS